MAGKHMTPAEKAAARPKSAKLAIAAFCYRCAGGNDDNPHLSKALVRDCPSNTCPLWPHRGWQNITTGRRSRPEKRQTRANPAV